MKPIFALLLFPILLTAADLPSIVAVNPLQTNEPPVKHDNKLLTVFNLPMAIAGHTIQTNEHIFPVAENVTVKFGSTNVVGKMEAAVTDIHGTVTLKFHSLNRVVTVPFSFSTTNLVFDRRPVGTNH